MTALHAASLTDILIYYSYVLLFWARESPTFCICCFKVFGVIKYRLAYTLNK